MQTLKLSVALPDETHSDMALHFSANDSVCDVVITLPLTSRPGIQPPQTEAPHSEYDDYVLGGYAGI